MAKRLSTRESKEKRKRDHDQELEENRNKRIEKSENFSSIEDKINSVYDSFSFPIRLMNKDEIDTNILKYLKQQIEEINFKIKIERKGDIADSSESLDSYKNLSNFIKNNPIVATFSDCNTKSEVNEKDNYFDNPMVDGWMGRVDFFLTFQDKNEAQLLNLVSANNSFWSYLHYKKPELKIVKRIWWKTILGIILSLIAWIPLSIFLQFIFSSTRNAPGFLNLAISFIISRFLFWTFIEFVKDEKKNEIGFKLMINEIYNKIDNTSLMNDLKKIFELYITEHKLLNNKTDENNKKNIKNAIKKIETLQKEFLNQFNEFKAEFLKFEELYFHTLFDLQMYYSTNFNFTSDLGENEWEEYRFEHDEFSKYLNRIFFEYELKSDELKVFITLPELKSFPINIYEFSRRNQEEFVSSNISDQKRKKYLKGILEATIINLLNILFINSFKNSRIKKITFVNLLSISDKKLIKNSSEYLYINEFTIEVNALNKIEFDDVETKDEANYILQKLNINFNSIEFDSLDVIKLPLVNKIFKSPFESFLDDINNLENENFDNNSYLYVEENEINYNHKLEELIKSVEYINITNSNKESDYINQIKINENKREVVILENKKRLDAKFILENETFEDRSKRRAVEHKQLLKDIESGRY